MDLEHEIDRLYQLPPDGFTAARNSLAKTLAGDAAREVKLLEKPGLAAWAVNQLHWQARPTSNALIDAAERLRQVQRAIIEGKKGDIRKAQDAHRAALRAAATRAGAILERAGLSRSPATLEAIERTLDALPRKGEVPGRLSRALEPGGFELLAGLTLKAPSTREEPKAKQERPAATSAHAAELKRALRSAEAASQKADAAVAAVTKELEAARSDEARKDAALAKAVEARTALEGKLGELQSIAERARAALTNAQRTS